MKLILVVSDDELIKEIAGTLETCIVKVLVVDRFELGKAFLMEVRSDLIITDLHLVGKETGINVALHAQKFTPPIPVLMVTASDITQTLLTEAKKAGVTEICPKSIGVNTLREKMLGLLDRLSRPKEKEE